MQRNAETPMCLKGAIRVILGDCIEGMRGMPDACVDLIIADPPYNLDKDFGAGRKRSKRIDGYLGTDNGWPNAIAS